jgi:hypothetical protein
MDHGRSEQRFESGGADGYRRWLRLLAAEKPGVKKATALNKFILGSDLPSGVNYPLRKETIRASNGRVLIEAALGRFRGLLCAHQLLRLRYKPSKHLLCGHMLAIRCLGAYLQAQKNAPGSRLP